MRRNLQTIAGRFGETVLPAGTEDLAEDLQAAIDAGHLPPVDVDYCAHAMIAVGLELGARMAERSPPDVEGATRFASALFLGALTSWPPVR